MTTASDMIYKLVNCATGFKKPEAMGAKKSMNTESDINPYINGIQFQKLIINNHRIIKF